MLRGLSVNACTTVDQACGASIPDCCTGLMCSTTTSKCCIIEDGICDPLAPHCCEGLSCLEVSSGNFVCEPPCEDHVGHSCEPGVRECCEDPIIRLVWTWFTLKIVWTRPRHVPHYKLVTPAFQNQRDFLSLQ